jgi:hypothetical protein
MGRLDHPYPIAGNGIAVAGDDDAFERAAPKALECRRQLGRALARPNHNGAPARPLRQSGAKRKLRVCRPHGRVEQFRKKVPVVR